MLEVFSFDFADAEQKMSSQKDLTFVVLEDGVLNCIAFWYCMRLTENVELDHCPEALRPPGAPSVAGDYQRHAIQWLSTPLEVSKGQEVHVRASHSRARIRFEVISPEVPKMEREVACARWLMLRLHDEQRAEAYRKAIEKALDVVQEERLALPELERKPVRVINLGAGLGQVAMIAAQAARHVGVTQEDVDIHGYSIIAIDKMPKLAKLVRRTLSSNHLEKEVLYCSEDVQ